MPRRICIVCRRVNYLHLVHCVNSIDILHIPRDYDDTSVDYQDAVRWQHVLAPHPLIKLG